MIISTRSAKSDVTRSGQDVVTARKRGASVKAMESSYPGLEPAMGKEH